MARAAHAIQKAVRRARACEQCRGTGHYRVDLHDVRCEACDGHGTATPRWAMQRIAHLEALVEQQRDRIDALHQELARARRDTLREAVDLDLAYQQTLGGDSRG